MLQGSRSTSLLGAHRDAAAFFRAVQLKGCEFVGCNPNVRLTDRQHFAQKLPFEEGQIENAIMSIHTRQGLVLVWGARWVNSGIAEWL
jgi:hypothetical protein